MDEKERIRDLYRTYREYMIKKDIAGRKLAGRVPAAGEGVP